MYLTNQDHQSKMSSREIAKLTGKHHKHVMDDIRTMCEQMEIDSAEFSAQYKDSTGRTLPCFELDRYHTEVLITGYDIKRRAAVIKRWYDLEAGRATPLHALSVEERRQLKVTELSALEAQGELEEQIAEAEEIRAEAEKQLAELQTSLATANPGTKFVTSRRGLQVVPPNAKLPAPGTGGWW